MDIYRSNPTCGCMRCRWRGLMAPTVLITLGVLFLLDQMWVVRFNRTWPIILLAIGAVRLFQISGSVGGHTQPPAAMYNGFAYRPMPPTPAQPQPPETQQPPYGTTEGR